MIRLRVLGPVSLVRTRSGASLDRVLDQPKRTALLAFLALDGGGGAVPRDRLVEVFWPDVERARALAALRRSLWFLRSELGSAVLPGKGRAWVELSADHVDCDAWTFEAAVRNRRHEDAARVYGGELLRGLVLRGVPEFERWLDGRRASFREAALRETLHAAESCEAGNELREADRWLTRALEISPVSETAVRRRIALLARAGRFAEAIDVFRRHARRLEADYDLEPTSETRRLVTAIRVSRGPERRPGPVPAGREAPPLEPSGDVSRAWATMDADHGANASAVMLFRELVRDDEANAEGHAGLAASLAHGVQLFGTERKALASAVASGRLAVSLEPRSPRARLGLGLALEVSGRLDRAADAFETALALDPTDPRARSALVRNRVVAGDFAGGYRAGREVVGLAPEDPHAHLQLGVGLFCMGFVDAAERWYERTLARWPRFPWAEQSLAYFAVARGDLDRAGRLVGRGAERAPGLGLFTKGLVALHRGDARVARDAFRRICDSDPETRHGALLLSARTFLAHVARETGENDEAEQLLRDQSRSNLGILATGAGFCGVFYDQAVVRALQGRPAQALEWLEASLAAGYCQAEYMARDPLLDPLRGYDRFRRVLEASRTTLADQRRSVGEP